MRVLLALHHPRLAGAGAAGATLRLGDALQEAGCEVGYAFYDEVFGAGPISRTHQLRYPWALARHVTGLRRRWCPDVLDVSTGDGWVLSSLCRAWGEPAPVIITRSHGLEHVHYARLRRRVPTDGEALSWRSRAYHGRYRLWEVARSLRTADHSVLLNSTERDFAEHVLHVPADRLSVVPLPLAQHFFTSPEAPPRSRGSRDARVVYVGRWEALKGAGVLSDGLAAVVESGVRVRVTLAGTGIGVEEVLASLPGSLRTRTTVIPEFAHDDVRRLLDAHDIFVMPSLSEGANVALSEAMARGLAVVATAVGAAPDHIRDGIDGMLVPVGDPTRLADAVCRLSRDRDLRRRVAAKAAQSARRHLPDSVAAQTITIYESSLRARRRLHAPV